MQTSLQQAIVLAVVVLNAYCFGANCVERFVNYQTWHLIPAEAFMTYHKAQQPLIQAFVIVPMVVGFMLQMWLAFRVPSGIDSFVIWVMVVATLIGAVSTLTLQLPIHAALNRSGYSPELMRRLLRTDWIRKAADTVRLAATAVLLHHLFSIR